MRLLQIRILNELNVPGASISLYNVPNLSPEYNYMNGIDTIVNLCSNSTITQ